MRDSGWEKPTLCHEQNRKVASNTVLEWNHELVKR